MATKDTQEITSDDVQDAGDVIPAVMTFRQLEEMLLDPSLDVEVDPLEAQKQIILRILNAEDESEVFGKQKVVHARDIIGMPFNLLSVQLLPSDYEGEGLQIYAAMNCVNEDGMQFVATCGAAQVVAQVFWAQTRGKLPLQLCFREKETPTKAGYKPLWLEFPSERSF